MIRKHLADGVDEIFLVANGEEGIADRIVEGERIVDCAIGRTFGQVEAELR